MRCTAHPKLRFFKCGSLWVIWVIATGVMSSAAFDMWHLQHFPSSFSLGLSSLHSILPRRREKSAKIQRKSAIAIAESTDKNLLASYDRAAIILYIILLQRVGLSFLSSLFRCSEH